MRKASPVGAQRRRRKGGSIRCWVCTTECVEDGLRILRGEQHSHHLTAILVMLKNFLTDQLAFTVAVGGEPNLLGGAQGVANGFELGGFVAALCRASTAKTFGPQQDRRPALPFRHHIFRFEQVEQMALGWENVSITRTNGGADIFGLA